MSSAGHFIKKEMCSVHDSRYDSNTVHIIKLNPTEYNFEISVSVGSGSVFSPDPLKFFASLRSFSSPLLALSDT